MDSLAEAGWFTTLEFRSGYHQVPMFPADADKTAFDTRRGTFTWRVMPFRLCIAPVTFQRLMHLVMFGLNIELCLVYMNDVFIFSRSPQ